jgi:hypothetical protein
MSITGSTGAAKKAIDGELVDGLLGVADSLAYKVQEIERHLHSYEAWFEVAAVPSGEVNIADRIGSGNGVFQVDAGNDTWGAWVQILGSGDTPERAGSAYYDVHEILFTTVERNFPYAFQVAYGDSGAAGLAAGDYTESMYSPQSNTIDSGPVELHNRRTAAGTKAWARCYCPGQDTGTMDFYFGFHEYEG